MLNNILKEEKKEIDDLEQTLHEKSKEYYKLKMRELVNTIDKFEKGRGIFYYNIFEQFDTVTVINIQDICEPIGESKVTVFTLRKDDITGPNSTSNSFEITRQILADCYARGNYSPEKYLTADEFLEFKAKAELDVVTDSDSALRYIKEIDKKRLIEEQE